MQDQPIQRAVVIKQIEDLGCWKLKFMQRVGVTESLIPYLRAAKMDADFLEYPNIHFREMLNAIPRHHPDLVRLAEVINEEWQAIKYGESGEDGQEALFDLPPVQGHYFIIYCDFGGEVCITQGDMQNADTVLDAAAHAKNFEIG